MPHAPHAVPPIEAVIETAIYATDLDAAARFYADMLGLPLLGRGPDRRVFFRVGAASMLLIFNPQTTIKGAIFPPTGRPDRGTSHSVSGPKRSTTGESTSARAASRSSRRSRGPAAGNAVELITPGVWGTPAGR